MRFLFFSYEILPLLKESDELIGGAAVQWKSWIKGFRDNGHEFGSINLGRNKKTN